MKNCTAIILAGGESRRMGVDKSMLPINGQPMIAYIAEQLQRYFKNIIVGANDINKYRFLNLPVVPDKEKNCGPLMGIISCLKKSTSDLNFICACDIPEIITAPSPLHINDSKFENLSNSNGKNNGNKPTGGIEFVSQMIYEAAGYDIVVPINENGHYEPLFAVYRKSIIPAASIAITSGERRIVKIFDELRVKKIDILKERWHLNLNTKEDYQHYLKQKR